MMDSGALGSLFTDPHFLDVFLSEEQQYCLDGLQRSRLTWRTRTLQSLVINKERS